MSAIKILTTLATLISSGKIFIEVQQLKISVNDDITCAEFSFVIPLMITRTG